MLKLHSLYFEFKSFVRSLIKAISFKASQTNVTHREYPTLRLIDLLPRLLIERYDQCWCCNHYLDLVLFKVLLKAFCDLLYLSCKLFILGLSLDLCLISQFLDFKETSQVTNCLCSIDNLKRLHFELDLQVFRVFVRQITLVMLFVTDSETNLSHWLHISISYSTCLCQSVDLALLILAVKEFVIIVGLLWLCTAWPIF